MNDAQKNQLINDLQEASNRLERFVKNHKTEILVGTTVVATVVAVKYRGKLKPFKGADFLEITPAQLDSIKKGGAGIYDVHGVDVIVRRVRPIDLGLSKDLADQFAL